MKLITVLLQRGFKFLFVLSLVGGFSVFAQAQTAASDVNQTDMQSVADFVQRAKEAMETPGNSLSAFRKEAKKEGGPWKSGSTYLIAIRDNNAIIHSNDPEAEDRNLREAVPEVGMLLDSLNSNAGTPQCLSYTDHEGVAGRYACAVTVALPLFLGLPAESFVLIGGLHHGKLPEEDFSTLLGSDYLVETEASDVVDAETLKSFVQGALEAFRNGFNVTPPPQNLSEFRPLLRRADGPWRHGDIYIFIMFDNNEVVFNANDPSLEDTSLSITDINNCNVGEEIIRVARDEDRQCPELGLLPEDPRGFVEYRWDNPDDPNDDDLRFKEGGRKDLSPGITPKLTYVESYETPRGISAIVGAGVYPSGASMGTEEDEECTNNDGCAIVESCNKPKNALFNLFLIGFVLFAVVLWGSRVRNRKQQVA